MQQVRKRAFFIRMKLIILISFRSPWKAPISVNRYYSLLLLVTNTLQKGSCSCIYCHNSKSYTIPEISASSSHTRTTTLLFHPKPMSVMCGIKLYTPHVYLKPFFTLFSHFHFRSFCPGRKFAFTGKI